MITERHQSTHDKAADGGAIVVRALLDGMMQIATEVSAAEGAACNIQQELAEKLSNPHFRVDDLDDLKSLLDCLEKAAPGSKERLARVTLSAFNAHFS